MTHPDGSAELLCGNYDCHKLWSETWPAMRWQFATFEEMQVLECSHCKALRAERCRVRRAKTTDTRHEKAPFTEAPYVVPFNLPKYFAQQLRAMQFAKAADPAKQVLWIVARDKAFLGDIKNLVGAELQKREAQWLQRHDMATNGIMGFLPAVQQMPVRFTATQNKEYKIFKNTRGVLVNWELHPVDVALLQASNRKK